VVRLTERATISADLTGDNPPDMDLELVDSDENTIDTSASASSSEILEGTCLEPGDYFVVVSMYSVGAQEGSYTISFDVDASGCADASACCTESTGPGCEGDSAAETCVCNIDSFCCSNTWDSTCAALAINECNLECTPEDSQGDCCEANGTPGCEYDAIEACACVWNGNCCEGQGDPWTQECVDTVNERCGGNCPIPV
jgi:hypothetical protein